MRLRKQVVRTPEDRVALIEEQIHESVYTAEVGWLRSFLARDVLLGVVDRDDEAVIRTIFRWVKSTIHYYPDPTGMDLYPTARGVVAMLCGDCDCHTILVASLLASIGFQVGCRVIRDEQSRLYHIYPLAAVPRGTMDGWIPVDTAWEGTEDIGDEYDPSLTDYRQDWIFELEG